jgi:hypothetical protein
MAAARARGMVPEMLSESRNGAQGIVWQPRTRLHQKPR